MVDHFLGCVGPPRVSKGTRNVKTSDELEYRSDELDYTSGSRSDELGCTSGSLASERRTSALVREPVPSSE